MNCLPGMPCYDDNIPPIIPDLVETSSFIGYPIISSFVYYNGTFLPNTGISNNEFLTAALQKIDPQMSAVSIAEKILNRMQTNPTYNSQICNVVYECLGGTTSTTTSTSTSTSTTTSTSTSTTSTTSTSSTTTTTTTLPPCDCHTVVNYTGGSLNVYYTNCAGVATTLPVASSTIIPICARSSFAITADPGLLVYNCLTSCTGGIPCSSCAPATTTSTSTTATPTTTTTTTTTTTAAPVTTTTTTTLEPTTTTTTTTVAPTTTTTTTLSYSSFSLTYSNSAGETACSDYALPTNRNFYYSVPGAVLATGTILYTTSDLTTPVANGFYSNGVNYWNTAASVGNLQNETLCSGITTTTTTTQTPTTTTTTTATPTTTTTTTTEAPATTTTTTTASPTTTTTTTAFVDPYDYYEAQVLSCATCQPVTVPPYPSQFTTVKVLRPFTANLNAAYNSNTPSAAGLFFDLVGVTTGPATIIINPTEYTTCNAVCGITTTTTTTATPTTTTTTTTVVPVSLSLISGCAGGVGTGTILAQAFDGGTGSFEYITISDISSADALNRLNNPATRTLLSGATEYTYTSLANNIYYVAIMDFDGNKGFNSTTVGCVNPTTTTTTSTSTTTTTTTLPPYRYYTIDRIATCNTGVENPAVGTLRLPYAFTPTLNGWYRDASGTCTYSYRLSNITPVSAPATPILVDATTYTTSTLACGPNCLTVDFSGSATCANVGASDAALTITSFTGGSGVFDATPANTTYATEAAALAGSFDNVTTSRTYSGLATGTYWVAIRDRNNISNKRAKSFTVTECPPAISLGSAYCADVACMTTGGSAVVPCGGGYNVNIANAPAGYTVTMTYSVQGGADGSYANLLNPSTGVYKVRAWFAAAGSNIVITLSLRNSSNVEVAQSVSIVSRNSPSNFLGLPACSSPSNVTLSPQNSLDGNSYTVFINGVEDAAWNSGTRSYPAYTTIKVVYSSPACGVVLNSTAYTSNTTITVVDGNAYTFTLYNANNYVDTGSAYCEGCQRRQGTINDCGTTSYRVLADNSCDCGVSCAGTYYDPQECSGNALIRRQRYTCDNTLTGVIDTIDSCSCSCNAGCDGTYWAANECSGDALIRRQFYYCNNAYTGVTEVLSNCSCSCNIGCGGTCEHQYCDGTTLMGILRYNCNSTGGVCNGTDAGSPYVIQYNNIGCGYVATYTLTWNLYSGTNFANMNIFVNGSLAANSTTSASGNISVAIGDTVEIALDGGDTDFVTTAISTSGFGNDPSGYYASCDLYSSYISTPSAPNRITVIGNCSVTMSTDNNVFGC